MAGNRLTIRFDRGRGPEEAIRFHFPAICPSFSSPLVNERNFQISGGGPWKHNLQRVAETLKPIGFVDGERQEMQEAAAFAVRNGSQIFYHTTRFDDGETVHFLSAAIPGCIDEAFDLDALLFDYRQYFSRYPHLHESVEREIGRIAPYEFNDFLRFSEVEVSWLEGPPTAGEYARCGLLLGYPVETTVATIGHYHRLAGFHREDVRLPRSPR